ncbi:MAG: hypothetical protein M3R27_05035 [Bacteroidota bacterium]|nr:hypothetical protein [Bacteroidota bacterium]
MHKCIQYNIECASLCVTAAQLLSIGSENTRQTLELCANACVVCANECSKYKVDHLQACAEACWKCASVNAAA